MTTVLDLLLNSGPRQVTIPLTGALPGGWTFSRAGNTATMLVKGVVTPVNANIPRFESASDGTPLGYLNELTATNIYLNSQAPATQTITVTAQSYVLSFYGTGTIVLTGTYTGTLVGTGANNLVQLVFTPTAGALVTTLTGSVANVQLEAGSFATSRIITAGTAVTRNVDNLIVPMSLYPWMFNNGTLVARVVPLGLTLLARVFEVDDGTTNNSILAYVVSATSPSILFYLVSVGGTPNGTNSVGTISPNISSGVGVTWGQGKSKLAAVSGVVNQFAWPIPTLTNAYKIGIANRPSDGGRPFSGHVLSVTLVGAAMSSRWMALATQ